MKNIDIDQQRKVFDEWVLKHPDNLDLTSYEENIMFDAWLAAQQQEGYVMVPVEPTWGMIEAGMEECTYNTDDATQVYKAMIQAAQE